MNRPTSQQGKKGTKPPAAPPARSGSRRNAALLVFGVLFIGLLAGAALGSGLGHPSVPDTAIAVIEDAPEGTGTITTEELDRALEQTAAAQGIQEIPPADDPQYAMLRDAAISDLILSRWVVGEAEDRGIEITEREIDEELDKVKEEQFGSDKAFEKFLEDSGFTLDEARQRIQLQLISNRIQETVLPGSDDPTADPAQLATDLDITDEQVEAYYEGNLEQFEQPESRDVRVILTKTEEEADQAKAELEKDSTPKGFEAVAKKYSIDEATKNTGGLREAVVKGQSEPALENAIFTAPEGELVGPLGGDAGFYLVQVETITPAETTPLDAPEEAAPDPEDPAAPPQGARDQITQTLVAARQQEIAQTFQEDFTAKWTARTFCATDFEVDRCSNAPALPNPCTEEIATTTGCGAPVPGRPVSVPAARGVFGAPAAALLAQGPITPVPAADPGALPPGLVPPPGTQQLPPGAPQQPPPPQGAPPPGAPPQGAPPQGAPAP